MAAAYPEVPGPGFSSCDPSVAQYDCCRQVAFLRAQGCVLYGCLFRRLNASKRHRNRMGCVGAEIRAGGRGTLVVKTRHVEGMNREAAENCHNNGLENAQGQTNCVIETLSVFQETQSSF